MTVYGMIERVVRDAGGHPTSRLVSEVITRIPNDTTVEDILAAEPQSGTAADVVAAIRTAVRLRVTGERETLPVAAIPEAVVPLPVAAPPEIQARGRALTRAELQARTRPDDATRLPGLDVPPARPHLSHRSSERMADLWSALDQHPPGR